MTGFLTTLIPFLGVLFVLVLVHELGHFVTAKLAGVTVKEFGFGYPPRLFAYRFRGTDYSLNLLPLGGFVKLAGEEDPREEGSFAAKRASVRLIILGAGSFMNALLPIALFTTSLLLTREALVEPARVGAVAPNSPAAIADIRSGDIVVAVNDRAVESRRDLSYNIQLNMGSEMAFNVQRDGETRTAYLTPRWTPPPGEGPTGITFHERVRVEAVAPGSPAEAAGIRVGDLVLQINGQPVNVLFEVSALIQQNQGSEVVLLLLRGSSPQEVRVTPRVEPPAGEGPMGVVLGAPDRSVQAVSYSLSEAVGLGVRSSFDLLSLFKNGLYGAIVGRSGPAITGPIGIAQATGEVARAGISPLLEWAALLSMNLAVLNILPIPMLDGGRMVFVLLEWVRRGRRISPEREGLVHMIGFVILMALIVKVSYDDIARLVEGGSLFP